MTALVDTDILIDAGRGVSDAIDCLESLEAQATLAVSVITRMELVVGCRNKAELRELNRFLERFDVLPLSESSSDHAVELLEQFRLSHGLLIPDALIAATALIAGCPFISKNQSDYRFIPNLRLLAYSKSPKL